MSSTDLPNPGASQQPQQYAPPQYAPPQYAHPQYADPRQPFDPGSPAPAPRGRVNALGIVALALVGVGALLNVFLPLLYRVLATSGEIGTAISAVGTVQAVLHVIAGGLAIGGVLQRNAPRFRWAAIGALVTSALWAISALGSLFTGWVSASMY